MNPKTNVGGRPSNVYGEVPKDLETRLGFVTKYATPDEALAQDLGFGTVGYLRSKTKQHVLRLTLRATDPEGRFLWVRLETADGSIDFSVPALMDRADLPKLLEQWELEDNVEWVEGQAPSPHFPDDFKCHSAYVGSTPFYVLTYELTTKDYHVVARASVPSIRRQNLRVAGIIGSADPMLFLQMGMRAKSSQMPLPPTVLTSRISGPLLVMLREQSAMYFREKLLTAVKQHPFIPHTEVLGIPAFTVTELVP